MPATKILIVEDEAIIAEDIAQKLTKAGYEVTATVDNCEAAIVSAKTNFPDLAFLDIEIVGNKDGIETAQELKLIGDIPVIFLTKFYDVKMIHRAMAVKPANYLNKPFTEHQLHVSIQMALYNTSEEKEAQIGGNEKFNIPENLPVKDKFFIKDVNGTFHKYDINDILYIEADRAYCYIHTTKGKLMQTINMKAIDEKINHPKLERTHRSYIVNIEAIEAIKGNTLIINDYEIPVGGEYKDAVFKRLQMIR